MEEGFPINRELEGLLQDFSNKTTAPLSDDGFEIGAEPEVLLDPHSIPEMWLRNIGIQPKPINFSEKCQSVLVPEIIKIFPNS